MLVFLKPIFNEYNLIVFFSCASVIFFLACMYNCIFFNGEQLNKKKQSSLHKIVHSNTKYVSTDNYAKKKVAINVMFTSFHVEGYQSQTWPRSPDCPCDCACPLE